MRRHPEVQVLNDNERFAAPFHLGQQLKDLADAATLLQRRAQALLRLAMVETECRDVDVAKRHRDAAAQADRTAWPAAARTEFDRLLTAIDQKLTTARMDPLPPP